MLIESSSSLIAKPLEIDSFSNLASQSFCERFSDAFEMYSSFSFPSMLLLDDTLFLASAKSVRIKLSRISCSINCIFFFKDFKVSLRDPILSSLFDNSLLRFRIVRSFSSIFFTLLSFFFFFFLVNFLFFLFISFSVAASILSSFSVVDFTILLLFFFVFFLRIGDGMCMESVAVVRLLSKGSASFIAAFNSSLSFFTISSLSEPFCRLCCSTSSANAAGTESSSEDRLLSAIFFLSDFLFFLWVRFRFFLCSLSIALLPSQLLFFFVPFLVSA